MGEQEREQKLNTMYEAIKENPGLRAKDVCRSIGKEHCWSLRKKLIERRLVRKEKDGQSMRYYPVDQ